jgi:hypothetical protein
LYSVILTQLSSVELTSEPGVSEPVSAVIIPFWPFEC